LLLLKFKSGYVLVHIATRKVTIRYLAKTDDDLDVMLEAGQSHQANERG